MTFTMGWIVRLKNCADFLSTASFVSALIFALSIFSGPASASTVYALPGGYAANQSFDGAVGMNFTVNSSNLVVNQIGAFTGGATAVTVTLFDLSNSNATVVSHTFAAGPAGTPYLWYSFPSIALTATHEYQITAWGYDGSNPLYNPDQPNCGTCLQLSFDDLGGALTQGSAYYNFTATGPATTLDLLTDTYGAGNLSIVATPLPAALPLFATSLGAMGLFGWRRKRKAKAAA